MSIKKYQFLILLISLVNLNCIRSKKPTVLNSDDYNTSMERVEILKKEIVYASEFSDAEFKLFNVNGFSNTRISVPGASSWDYELAIKVKPSDLDKWTEGMIPIEITSGPQWTKTIIEKRKDNWLTSSDPECYIRKDSSAALILYRKEGIIFKKITNL